MIFREAARLLIVFDSTVGHRRHARTNALEIGCANILETTRMLRYIQRGQEYVNPSCSVSPFRSTKRVVSIIRPLVREKENAVNSVINWAASEGVRTTVVPSVCRVLRLANPLGPSVRQRVLASSVATLNLGNSLAKSQ